MRRLAIPCSAAVLSLALTAIAAADFTPSGLLEIHTIDIGQANSTLVIGPDGTTILLEAGKADESIHDYLTGLGMVPGETGDRLDYTLAGHIHVDHFRGFKNLFEPPAYWPGDREGFEVSTSGKNWYNGSDKFDVEVANPSSNTWAYADAASRTGGGYPEPVPMG